MQAISASPKTAAAARDQLTRDTYALMSYLMREATLGTLNTIAELEISFTQMKALCALVAARRDVLRAVHDHARQHRRERRAALDPARPARDHLRARVDRQRVHAHFRRAARHRRAAR